MGGTSPATAHPILACATSIADALTKVSDVDPLYMAPEEKAAALLELQQGLDRLAELQLRVLASSEDLAAIEAASDPATWLAVRGRLDRGDARRRQRLARSLESTRHRLAEALRDGKVNLEQAHVIARALDELPDDLDAAVVEKAEKHLIDQAGEFNPRALRRLGRRILEVVDQEAADEAERKLLEDEERQARKRTWFTARDQGDGTTLIRGRIPTSLADRLRTYLEAFGSPRRAENRTSAGAPGTAGTRPTSPDRAPYDVRLGRAFCGLLEAWDPARMPIHGGAATTVMVTVDLDTLLGGLGVATTGTGEKITAGEARRLACMAGLVPAVLGTDSEVLDLGRTARLYNSAQRKAMALRDKTCRAEGCDKPAAWCEAHHLRAWAKGGRTDLGDGILLCSWHHHRAHDPDYRTERLASGDLRFHRRT